MFRFNRPNSLLNYRMQAINPNSNKVQYRKTLNCNCTQTNTAVVKNTCCVQPIKTIQNKNGVKNNEYCYDRTQYFRRKYKCC